MVYEIEAVKEGIEIKQKYFNAKSKKSAREQILAGLEKDYENA